MLYDSYILYSQANSLINSQAMICVIIHSDSFA